MNQFKCKWVLVEQHRTAIWNDKPKHTHVEYSWERFWVMSVHDNNCCIIEPTLTHSHTYTWTYTAQSYYIRCILKSQTFQWTARRCWGPLSKQSAVRCFHTLFSYFDHVATNFSAFNHFTFGEVRSGPFRMTWKPSMKTLWPIITPTVHRSLHRLIGCRLKFWFVVLFGCRRQCIELTEFASFHFASTTQPKTVDLFFLFTKKNSPRWN